MRAVGVVLAAAALLLTACSVPMPDASPSSSPSPTIVDPDFAALAESMIEDARAAGATDAQLTILERTAATGTMTYQDVQDAVDATFACWEQAGVAYQELSAVEQNGIMYPQYTFEGGKEAVADDCLHKNSNFVEVLYMRQPAAMEVRDAAFIAAMPALIDCLNRLGIEVDPDIPPDELAALILIKEVEVGTPMQEQAEQRMNCLSEAGIHSL